MGSKKETINRIFQELKERGMIRNKKEFATLLGVEYTNLVAAMNGNEKSLTDSLVAKAVSLLPDNEPLPKKEKTDIEKAIEAIQSSNQITLKAQEADWSQF